MSDAKTVLRETKGQINALPVRSEWESISLLLLLFFLLGPEDQPMVIKGRFLFVFLLVGCFIVDQVI